MISLIALLVTIAGIALLVFLLGFTATATGNSNSMRYRYGETNPASLPFWAGQQVSIGDLCAEAVTGSINGSIIPAAAWPWQSAVTAASAPTLADGGAATATAFTNAATHVKVSYQYPWGEGVLSSATSVTPTAHAMILLTGVALPAPAVGLNVYVETSAGSGTYKLWNTIYGDGQGIVGDTFITGYGKGQSPPASPPGEGATIVNQYYFAQQFVGVADQAYDGTTGTRPGAGGTNAIGIADGYIRYSSSGTFEFAIAAGTYSPGQLVGVAANATPNALLSQSVAIVTSPVLAIGMVDNVVSVSSTLVKVKVSTKNLNLTAATTNAIV
jgi:hypothetical protein